MSIDPRTHVLLLRDVPEQRLLSMERLADEVERGFRGDPAVHLSATTVHASPSAARFGLGRADGYMARFVRYPLALRRRRADVYHIIDHGYAHLSAMLPPERTVVSCHDLMLLKAEQGAVGTMSGGRVATARFRWSTSYLAKVARVVTPTEATKRDLVALRGVDPERISVVPYGVDTRFRPLPPERRAWLRQGLPGAAAHVLLHVSTGDAYKNVSATLPVIAGLRESGLDVTLLRAGRPLDAAQRALAGALDITDRIIDCGRVSDERLVELYNAADALIFPSFWEGYGWPPLEAMACGTPVVASDIAPLLEVLGDAAVTAPPADIDALVRATRTLLTSPALADDMRMRGLRRAAEYPWSRTIAGFALAYADVAAGALSETEGRTSCAA